MPRRVREQSAEGGGASVAYTLKDVPADERPRERLLRDGPRGLTDPELLAILLRVGYEGKMVTELARELYDELGGFWGIHGRQRSELVRIKGLKGAKIATLQAAMEIGRRMAAVGSDRIDEPQVTRPEVAHQLLRFDLVGLSQEEIWVLLLDTRHRLIGRPRSVVRGSANAASLRMADLFRDAIREGATAIVVAHNHPSGDPTPSQEDARVTGEIVRAAHLLDIDVLDHLVIARDGWRSLRQLRMGFDA